MSKNTGGEATCVKLHRWSKNRPSTPYLGLEKIINDIIITNHQNNTIVTSLDELDNLKANMTKTDKVKIRI